MHSNIRQTGSESFTGDFRVKVQEAFQQSQSEASEIQQEIFKEKISNLFRDQLMFSYPSSDNIEESENLKKFNGTNANEYMNNLRESIENAFRSRNSQAEVESNSLFDGGVDDEISEKSEQSLTATLKERVYELSMESLEKDLKIKEVERKLDEAMEAIHVHSSAIQDITNFLEDISLDELIEMKIRNNPTIVQLISIIEK